MAAFRLTIRNLRGLRHIEWAPDGVSVVIGPNGAGKSTLFLALKLLRMAIDRTLPEAVSIILGGSEGLKHLDATEDEPVRLQVELDDIRWCVDLLKRGPTVDYLAEETLHVGERCVFKRDSLGNFVVEGERWPADERVGLRAVLESQQPVDEVVRMATLLRGITVFHDVDAYHVRHEGSNTAQSRHLHSRGHNALTLLRRWNQERPVRWRYAMVCGALRAAFPAIFDDLDFQEAGATLVARVYRPGQEVPVSLAHESNGLVTMLVSMCALVAAEEGGIVAIDEVGEAMHPHALRVFARQTEGIARQRHLTILLSSHSTVLLDHLSANPERVYALTRGTQPGPVPLTQLRNPKWLAQFRLGELYAEGELDSNDTDDP